MRFGFLFVGNRKRQVTVPGRYRYYLRATVDCLYHWLRMHSRRPVAVLLLACLTLLCCLWRICFIYANYLKIISRVLVLRGSTGSDLLRQRIDEDTMITRFRGTAAVWVLHRFHHKIDTFTLHNSYKDAGQGGWMALHDCDCILDDFCRIHLESSRVLSALLLPKPQW